MNTHPINGPRINSRLFVNYYEVGFNHQEFLVNLGQFYENDSDPRLDVYLVTTPAYAKKLLSLLEQSVRAYESQYGEIQS